MVCSCTHIRPAHSFLESIIEAPKHCFESIKKKMWKGATHDPILLLYNKQITVLKPETVIADIKKCIDNITPEDLSQKLKELSKAALESGNAQGIPSCLALFSKDQLYNAAGIDAKATALKIDTLHSLNSSAPFSLKTKIRNFFRYTLNFIPNLLNIVLTIFHLFDTGKDPQTFWEIGAALGIIYKFVMIPAAVVLVVHCLVPGLGLAAYAITAGIVIALIALIAVYAKWLKPCPKQLAKCRNLTMEAAMGKLSPVVGRVKEVDKIITTFISNKKCKHPILVGKSGVGKNEVVSALAQRIASGDVPDSLKGKEVFQISSALLSDVGGFGDPIGTILQRLQGHEDQVLFFFDEIHTVFKNESLRNYMKEFVDKFHCIVATTPDEYEKIHEDIAFGSRFEAVEVNPMEDLQVKEVLYQLTSGLPTPLHITESGYEAIICQEVKEKERSQPARSKATFLDIVGKKMLELEEEFVPEDLAQMRADYRSLTISSANTSHVDEKIKQNLEELKSKITEKEIVLIERRKWVKHYNRVLSHYLHHRQTQAVTAANILSLQEKKQTEKADQQIKQFLFEQHYFLPELEDVLKKLEEKFVNEFGFDPSIKE